MKIKDMPTTERPREKFLNNSIDNLMWLERGINSSVRNNKGQGELNHESILTEQQVIEIIKLLEQNYNVKEIAKKYNVHISTISNIKCGKTWLYLTSNYNFNNHTLGSKEEQQQRIEQIKKLLLWQQKEKHCIE